MSAFDNVGPGWNQCRVLAVQMASILPFAATLWSRHEATRSNNCPQMSHQRTLLPQKRTSELVFDAASSRPQKPATRKVPV